MAFAPCACCKRLSRMALEEAFAVQSRDNDKAADALLRCRPCLKEAEAEAASAPKGGSSKGHGKGGKGNVSDSHKSSSKGKAATAATAATASSGYATLVCLTCGHSCCESHAMTHCQSASSTNKKDRGPGDHCVFLNHGGGSLLHQSVAGFCFRCQIPVGGGEPEDLDFAENRGGAAVNSEGYCIDFEDTFSDPANVVIEMMVNGRTAARGKAGDSDGEGGDDRRRRKKEKLDKKEKRHKRDRDDVEKSSRKRKHRDGGGGDVESAAVRATNKAAMKEGGMVGLQNMGNTCFYNSTLQCLSRAAPLTAAFANLGTSQFCPGPLSQSIFSTLETMLDPSNAGTTIVPKGLFNQLCRRNCMFSEYGQQDAQEVFSCIMNSVEDEYQVRGGGSTNSPTMVVGGQLRSSILCSQCRTTTSREDRFLDLSVAVQGGIRSIGAALRAYFLPEELSGENAYACERCHAERFAAEKRRVEAEKLARQREAQSLCEAAALEPVTETVDRVRDEDNSSDDDDDSDSSSCCSDEAAAGVAAAEVVPKSAQSVAAAIPIAPMVPEPAVAVEEPLLGVKPRSGGSVKVDAVMTPSVAHLGDVIVVHLKRFAVNMRTLTWEKSDAVVAIDPIIDMAPYLSSAPTRKTLYALSGVVSHSGSLSGGHYIAYVKSATNHQWYRCSDESVSLSSESSALSAQCYMAFYTLAE